MNPVLFVLPGGIPIYGYGFMLAIGILAGAFGTAHTASKEGVARTRLYDFGLLSFFFGVVGGRLEYVRTHWADKFAADPWSALALRDGGYVFYGGFVCAVVACVLWGRRHNVPLARVADHAAPFIGVGIGFARLGCFLVGCCYGCPTELPWGVSFPEGAIAPEGVVRHPTQLYESFFAFGVLFGGLSLFRTRLRPFEGSVIALFGVLYGCWRIFVETLRCDGERGYVFDGWMTNGQFTSLFIIGIAVALGIWLRRLDRLRTRTD